MNPPGYDRMFDNEDRYWWFVSRRELVIHLVGRLGLPASARLVDVGCGTGATARALGRFGSVVAVDLSDRALGYCARRGLDRLVRGRVEALLLASDGFDVLVWWPPTSWSTSTTTGTPCASSGACSGRAAVP